MKLLALLLLLGVVYPSLNEVVQSFKAKCPEFFIKNLHSHKVDPPTLLKGKGNQFKCICQRWNGKYRFATLYDIKRRIPIYSAYKFEGNKGFPRTGSWKIEPQLDDCLKPEKREMIELRRADEEKLQNQARNKDYPQTGDYTRGHLFPHSYAADAEQAESTLTLTNAAPQMQESNEAWANHVEQLMREDILYNCMVNKTFPAYIVTGVVPGNVWVAIERKQGTIDQVDNVWVAIGGEPRTIEQGVNIPSHYWLAYMCINSTLSRRSRAFLAQQIYKINSNSKTKFKKSNMTVADLESKLTDLFKQPFRVF